MKKNTFPDLPLMLKGAGIGIANAVPGVSGGTIAVITGIYDRTISAVSGFFSNEFGWKNNLLYLVQLAIGLFAGLLGFANLIGWLVDNMANQTQFWFIGLILGSLPYLVKIADVPKLKYYHWIVFLGFLIPMIILGLQERPPATPPIRDFSVKSAFLVFSAGIISTATMVIPGISGSFVLLMLGLYSTFITAIRELNFPLLGVFILGSILGIILVSKLIHFVLKHFHGIAYSAIIGLVLGSVMNLLPGFDPGWMILTDIAAFTLGFGMAFLLGSGKKTRHTKESQG